jgi:hypothetical protein
MILKPEILYYLKLPLLLEQTIMKIILTGATGVLGSHIMYEILELFINTKIDGKLFIIAKQRKKTLKIA